MTPILAPFVTTPDAWTSHGRQCAALGLVIGVLLAVVVGHWGKADAVDVIADPRMEAACKFPQREGEFLAVTVLNDQLKCWRYK